MDYRVNAMAAILVALYVFVIFGTLHLVALSYPDSRLSKAFIGAGF